MAIGRQRPGVDLWRALNTSLEGLVPDACQQYCYTCGVWMLQFVITGIKKAHTTSIYILMVLKGRKFKYCKNNNNNNILPKEIS